LELNEKVIAEKVEAKINELYINKVLGETTIIGIQALSMGYRPIEVVRFLEQRGTSISYSQCNVLKHRYKDLIKEAKRLFDDLNFVYDNQIAQDIKNNRGKK